MFESAFISKRSRNSSFLKFEYKTNITVDANPNRIVKSKLTKSDIRFFNVIPEHLNNIRNQFWSESVLFRGPYQFSFLKN
ncbi:hypothetical protein D3C72_2198380 [compost metagenome]